MPQVWITRIKCLHPSAGTDRDPAYITGVDLQSRVENVVDASDSCLLATKNGVLAVESQIAFAGDSDMGSLLAGTDTFYFKCWSDDDERVRWSAGYENGVDMNRGTERIVDDVTFTFTQKGDIRLYEYDTVSDDDDMGGLTWYATSGQVYGSQSVIVQSRNESSCYQISYRISE